MPITHAEWDRQRIDPETDDPLPDPVGEFETEEDLVVAFLSENHEQAFTRTEIVRGVDFGETDDPEAIRETLLDLPNQLLDVAGELAASGIVVDDVSEALDSLVTEGTVERARIQRRDGEVEIYYRLAKG